MTRPKRTYKVQNARRRKLGRRDPEKAIAEHKKREERRKKRVQTT